MVTSIPQMKKTTKKKKKTWLRTSVISPCIGMAPAANCPKMTTAAAAASAAAATARAAAAAARAAGAVEAAATLVAAAGAADAAAAILGAPMRPRGRRHRKHVEAPWSSTPVMHSLDGSPWTQSTSSATPPSSPERTIRLDVKNTFIHVDDGQCSEPPHAHSAPEAFDSFDPECTVGVGVQTVAVPEQDVAVQTSSVESTTFGAPASKTDAGTSTAQPSHEEVPLDETEPTADTSTLSGDADATHAAVVPGDISTTTSSAEDDLSATNREAFDEESCSSSASSPQPPASMSMTPTSSTSSMSKRCASEAGLSSVTTPATVVSRQADVLEHMQALLQTLAPYDANGAWASMIETGVKQSLDQLARAHK